MIEFIRTIRASDTATKKKWFLIFSAIGIALALMIWVVSFKAILHSIESPEVEVREAETEEPLSSRFKSAFSELGSNLSRGISNIKSLLSKEPLQITATSTITK